MSDELSGGRSTTCDKCGEARKIYPPTPEYPELLLEPCSQGDSIERPFQCNECGEMNRRYWDKAHGYSISSRGSTTERNEGEYRPERTEFSNY